MKLYVREPGTERLLSIAARSSANSLVILSLSQVEFCSAVRRRERNGEIPAVVANQLLDLFKRHAESRLVRQAVTDYLIDLASALVDRHGLRAFDAIQLAGYLALKTSVGAETPIFVCADHGLLSAAELEGVPILDPCS